MQRLTLLLLAIFAFTLSALATPIPTNKTVSELEKRVTHTGRGTWFNVGLGNCGYTDKDSDPIVAISKSRYGSGGNCNQWVRIVNKSNGKVAYGKTRDSCPGCGSEDLDLSPSLFQKLAPLSQGVVQISWNFEPKGWSP